MDNSPKNTRRRSSTLKGIGRLGLKRRDPQVRIVVRPVQEDQLTPSAGRAGHAQRIQQFQVRWHEIKEDLPPQLSRRHITMISIGGVIGTGVFLGTAEALHNGGPLGLLLGYAIVGSIVFCVVVSVAEMVAFLPNVGGVVGLADLFVDPALGFTMGWNAWYNWAVILPAEISAATVLMDFLSNNSALNPVWVTILLSVAVGINCLGTRLYGETEFWFAMGKVFTIVALIFISLYIDLRKTATGRIGFRYWRDPGPFANYLGIEGPRGHFMGFLAVLMQASFSFFGAEVAGVAAGEVIDPSRNIPHAVRRIWVRITLFYIVSVFAAGLIVSHNDPMLTKSGAPSSPFVIAMTTAGFTGLAQVVNFGFVTSAWSAGASDIYISSRYLFFLARCHHAPKFFGSLFQRRPIVPPPDEATSQGLDGHEQLSSQEMAPMPSIPGSVSTPTDVELGHGRQPSDSHGLLPVPPDSRVRNRHTHQASRSDTDIALSDDGEDGGTTLRSGMTTPSRAAPIVPEVPIKVRKRYGSGDKTVPWVGVLVAGLIGLLAYMGVSTSKSGGNSAPIQAFNHLAAMASVASLQSWICMLGTYLQWYRATRYAEKHDPDDFGKSNECKFIRDHRTWGQPWLAVYALIMCLAILICNGWAVFSQDWVIAHDTCDPPPPSDPQMVPKFISSYLPLPISLLLFFGYKLIKQTQMVRFEDMNFTRGYIPPPELVGDDAWYQGAYPVEESFRKRMQYRIGRLWYHLF